MTGQANKLRILLPLLLAALLLGGCGQRPLAAYQAAYARLTAANALWLTREVSNTTADGVSLMQFSYQLEKTQGRWNGLCTLAIDGAPDAAPHSVSVYRDGWLYQYQPNDPQQPARQYPAEDEQLLWEALAQVWDLSQLRLLTQEESADEHGRLLSFTIEKQSFYLQQLGISTDEYPEAVRAALIDPEYTARLDAAGALIELSCRYMLPLSSDRAPTEVRCTTRLLPAAAINYPKLSGLEFHTAD